MVKKKVIDKRVNVKKMVKENGKKKRKKKEQ
jgi:hypothetical protein